MRQPAPPAVRAARQLLPRGAHSAKQRWMVSGSLWSSSESTLHIRQQEEALRCQKKPERAGKGVTLIGKLGVIKCLDRVKQSEILRACQIRVWECSKTSPHKKTVFASSLYAISAYLRSHRDTLPSDGGFLSCSIAKAVAWRDMKQFLHFYFCIPLNNYRSLCPWIFFWISLNILLVSSLIEWNKIVDFFFFLFVWVNVLLENYTLQMVLATGALIYFQPYSS